MIKAIEFINFKAFKDSNKVDLKKINILVGPNSGGKSSFIKGILTLKIQWKVNTMKQSSI
ncbi:AAA family ATPase [Clostridium bovifaecis]|uniref:AAA family ATPase n=1 Tax=Clostridium bovifaecis TaxID=2184719 RepID=A0A6I6EVA9_9CLOT|nr:AAA family ATPase [Clostridium bovifaecis]